MSWSKLMKFKLLMASGLGLMPYNIWAQAPATKECRTLEAAGNFIGGDEALVDGMVCKIAKNKATSPAAAATAGIVTEANSKPMVRSLDGKTPAEEKPNPTLSSTESSANTKSQPGDAATAGSVAGINGATMEVNRGLSVAEAARAYQKNAKHRPTENSDSLRVAKTPAVPASPAKVGAPVAATPPASPTLAERTVEIQAEVPAVKPAATVEANRPAERAISAPMIQPVATGAVAEKQVLPEGKIETVPATPLSEAPPAEPKSGVFDPTMTPEPIARSEVRPALPPTDSDSSSERPQLVKMGGFEPPEDSTDMEKTVQPIDPFGSPLEEAPNQGPRPGCTRIISLGSLEKDRLVLATPDWAVQWLEKNQKKYPGVCFSDTPSAGVPNYLIVFSTAVPAAQQIEPATTKPASDETSAGPASGTFTTNFGSTWHYTYEKTPTTTVTTDWGDKVPHNLQTPTLYATAYTEQGAPVCQHRPVLIKEAEKESPDSHGRKHDPLAAAARAMGELLGQMLADMPRE
ncbi:MAG TPA: hypothetical protein VH110_01110 [Candidatus Acidoferrum sp.]|nr:hypothetical protein [Candidatus Acidoferrum sp.]